MNYVIRNESENEELLFWSNEEGWTDLNSATQFTEEEKQQCSKIILDSFNKEFDNCKIETFELINGYSIWDF